MSLRQDAYNLQRFVDAQKPVYGQVLAELRSGRKRGHWIWFIFPQLDGLGRSETARLFAISSAAEAAAYFDHPVLGPRLRECVALVTRIDGQPIEDILGHPDDLKFRSCLTLFAAVAADHFVFDRALEKFYGGRPDPETLQLLSTATRKSPPSA